MDSELIAKALNNACQDDNLNFQIILQDSILHIYINREVDSELNYAQLVNKISDTLTSLHLSLEGFWLYSRVMGEIEPDWQTYVEFQVNLSDNKPEPLIEQTEDLITEAKESLKDLKYLQDKDVLSIEELDENVLNKDSFLLVMESAEEIENSMGEVAEEELDDLFVVEELDDAILDENPEILAIESAEEIENSTGEIAEEELDDLFVIEELDDAILNKNSELLAIESAEEIENSMGEVAEEELDDPFVVEELDDAILNKNSFLLIMESAEEIENSTGEVIEEELDDLFVVEELEEEIPEQESDISAIESNNKVDHIPDEIEENDISAIEKLDDENCNVKSNNLAIDSDDNNQDNLESISTESIDFSEYCFIRNQRLLESDLLAPKLNIAHLISFFHDLSQENKKLLLPLLNQHFKLEQAIPHTAKEQFSPDIQEWLQQIIELNLEATRKAAIWFSRYCLNPEKTRSEIQKVFDAEAAKQAASQDSNQNNDNLHNNNNLQQNSPTQNYQSSNHLPSHNYPQKQAQYKQESSKKLTLTRINILVPIFWTAATIFFVSAGIISNNSNAINAEGIPVICENVINAKSSDHCQLAVDLVGQQILEEVSQEAIPFSSGKEYVAKYNCEKYANIKAGVSLAKASPIHTSVINSHGEEILPGIYFVEAKQHNFKEEGNNTVRVACTFVNQKESPAILASDIIPNNWPVEKYQGKTAIRQIQSLSQALDIYSIFVVMGFGTLFTAIGLFIASMLDWGITINSLDVLYKSAFVLGIVEVIFSSLPMIGFFALIALQTLAIGITSAFIKGFKVNWSDGYLVVCLGTVTVLGVRTILHLLLILLISAFIA